MKKRKWRRMRPFYPLDASSERTSAATRATVVRPPSKYGRNAPDVSRGVDHAVGAALQGVRSGAMPSSGDSPRAAPHAMNSRRVRGMAWRDRLSD